MPDVKKLITGFLIVAAGASSSVLILSNLGNGQAAGSVAQNQPSAAATTTIPENAFYPTQNAGTAPDENATATDQTDPNNLTDGMADAFVNSVVAANSNGIQTDANGNAQLATPDAQTVADALQSETAFQNVTVPDWDAGAAKLENEIKVVPYSTTTVTNYITSLDDAVNNQLVKTGLSAMAQNNNSLPDNESAVVAAGQSAVSNMLSSALNSPTPAPLINFQKSFIKMLVYEQDMAQLAQNNSQDPAAVEVTLQAKENDYQAAVQNFMTQGQEASDLLSSYGDVREGTPGALSLFRSMFFVDEAQAAGWPVFDWVNAILKKIDTALQTQNAWAIFFEKLAKDMALQIGKNMIMALIQQKVLAYIQNSGAPRFVTNMGTELVQAGEMSAINAINSNFACITPGTGPLGPIQITLNAIYKPGNNVCASTFASALSGGVTPQQFYNDFSKGGFVAFGETLQPSNNFYGGLFFAAQAANQAQQQTQSVFTLKTTASQGYRPSQVCPKDNSNPNGFYCQRSNGSKYNVPTANCPNSEDTLVANDGQCTDGSEPSVTMPGIVNAQALDSTLGGSKAMVSAAKDLAGLAQFAAQDLLMGLVNQGIQGATKLVNGALQGSNGGDITSLSSSSIVAAVPSSTLTSALSCSPGIETLEATDTPASFFAIGGTYDMNGNPPTYYWTSSDGQTGSGNQFSVMFNDAENMENYTVTLGDSASDASTTCVATIQIPSASSSVLQVDVNNLPAPTTP
jgi:hypothetical protein